MRTYTVVTGPLIVENDEGQHLVTPPTEHIVVGSLVKHQSADVPFFQILDNVGAVVFAAPAHTIMYCKCSPVKATVLSIVPPPKKKKKKET